MQIVCQLWEGGRSECVGFYCLRVQVSLINQWRPSHVSQLPAEVAGSASKTEGGAKQQSV